MKKQIALIVLDGWGYREDTTHNAIAQSRTPVFHKMWETYPHTLLEASGLAVGLPEGQMGNSEVGHMTIGAGRPLDQELVRINKAIDSGEYASNPAFLALFAHVKEKKSTLHVQGLLSPGGVHSHMEHLFAFLRAARENGVPRVAIHVFTDGRDTPPQSAAGYIKDLEKVLDEIGIGFIASISGRFYAMDRDNNWDRLSKAEQAMFECKGNVCTLKPSEFVENLYKENKLDEHLEPIVCLGPDGKGCAITTGDGVFFFNFRSDRAKMLTTEMIKKSEAEDICFVTLTDYGPEFTCLVAFPPTQVETTLAKELSKAGMTQAHIAETEKFPHATYFLNGGVEDPYPGEEHILVPSNKDVPTHDMKPEMQAAPIADKAVEAIEKGTDFIFINFANADMVGHTANVPAIIRGVEAVDTALGKVLDALHARGGIAFITADHGNAEINIDPETGERHTAHTTSKVPAILTDTTGTLHTGTLADITPTILTLFGLPVPSSMTGKSLID